VLPEDLHALVGGSFSVQGNLTELPSLRGQITIDPLEVRASGFDVRPNGRLMVGLERGRVSLAPVTIAVGADPARPGATVRLDHLHLELTDALPMLVRGEIEVADIRALLGEGRAPERLTAALVGAFSLGGDLATFSSLRGRMTIRRLNAQQGDLMISLDHPLSLILAEERLTVPQGQILMAAAGQAPTTFNIDGWVSPEEMLMDLNGSLELDVLASLVGPVRRSQGTLSLECRVSGSPLAPHITGTAHLRGARLEVEGLPRAIENLEGTVRFSERAILLEDFRAQVLGGDATIHGRVDLEGLGLESYRLDLVLHDGMMPIGGRSSVVFNTELTVASPQDEETLPLVSGTVDVVQLRYQEPINLDLNVTSFVRRGRTEVATYDASAAVIRLNLAVTQSGDLLLDNNIIEARVLLDETGGPLRVVGTDQAIGVLGSVRLEQGGSVTYRNTRFEIDRALLQFNRRSEIDAGLNVIASTEIRDWNITLRVLGTMNAPDVQLTSDPSMNELDIILLLAYGMTQSEFLQAGASAVLADMIIGGLDDEIAEVIPIFDEFRVTTEYSQTTNRVEPQVRVGRDLGENVRLGGIAGLSDVQNFRANLEYEIVDDLLSLEVSYANDPSSAVGNIGADMTFRVEF
jgi:translocation and assembly module TamB